MFYSICFVAYFKCVFIKHRIDEYCAAPNFCKSCISDQIVQFSLLNQGWSGFAEMNSIRPEDYEFRKSRPKHSCASLVNYKM